MKPAGRIQQRVEERRCRSDAEIMAELVALPPLPDEDDPTWDDEATWREHAEVYVALGDLTAERRLRAALLPLLERACFGDPGEMMRGLRHTLEAIVNPEWEALTAVCIEAARHPRPGTRYWAVEELGVLRGLESLEALILTCGDEEPSIREAARDALVRLCDEHPSCRPRASTALRPLLDAGAFPDDRPALLAAIQKIESLHQ